MLFLPSYIKWLTNFDTFTSPKTGSGRMILFFGLALRIVLFVFVRGCFLCSSTPPLGHLLNLTNKPKRLMITFAWDALLRTLSGAGCGWLHQRYQAYRERCDNAHRGDPSHDRRAPARCCAPAGCVPHRECNC